MANEEKAYKRARGIKGHCEVCGRWVIRGDYFTTTGTDGYGGLCGLTHKDCHNTVELALKREGIKR